MPGGDRTRRMGRGVMSGRGRGYCIVDLDSGAGRRLGYGPGLRNGRGRSWGRFSQWSEKDLLEDQKELLQSRLNVISEQLDNLSESAPK